MDADRRDDGQGRRGLAGVGRDGARGRRRRAMPAGVPFRTSGPPFAHRDRGERAAARPEPDRVGSVRRAWPIPWRVPPGPRAPLRSRRLHRSIRIGSSRVTRERVQAGSEGDEPGPGRKRADDLSPSRVGIRRASTSCRPGTVRPPTNGRSRSRPARPRSARGGRWPIAPAAPTARSATARGRSARSPPEAEPTHRASA